MCFSGNIAFFASICRKKKVNTNPTMFTLCRFHAIELLCNRALEKKLRIFFYRSLNRIDSMTLVVGIKRKQETPSFIQKAALLLSFHFARLLFTLLNEQRGESVEKLTHSQKKRLSLIKA